MVWPLWGATMVSLAVELGRAARLVGAGVGVELPVSEQAPRSRTTRVTRTRRAMLVLLGCWYMAFTCHLICWEKLAVIGGALGRGGVDREGGLSGLEVEVGGEMTGRQQLKVDALLCP